MSIEEENIALTQRVIDEIWNAKNISLIDEIFAAETVAHDLPASIPATREGFKMVVAAMCKAFPDAKFKTLEATAEDDKVTVRWKAEGTHIGDFMGIQATNKRVTWSGTTIYRITDGKIFEWWNQSTLASMLQ